MIDMLKYIARDIIGQIKENVGKVLGNNDLQAQGKADQVEGNLKQAGEHATQAGKNVQHAGENVKDALS